MPFDLHAVEVVDGSDLQNFDKIILAMNNAVANASAAVNTPVTTAVSFANELPAAYNVLVTPSQACFVSVTGKTTSGFNVVLTPTTSSTSISAGTFDVVVLT